MKINKLTSIVFSPTDSTSNVVKKMLENTSAPTVNVDVTCCSINRGQTSFAEDDLVIFASPVYGGRIPHPAV